jgi:5-formyltetrahydrofolate cyclo-ligase
LNSRQDPPGEERRRLRRELRARRQAITGAARHRKARQLAARIASLGLLRPGTRIGLYLATAEEIDTAPLLSLAEQRGCRVSLPRVVNRRQDRMLFHEQPGGRNTARIRRGAFGIQEPQGGTIRAARELDIVFMPLVGFDAAGHRIGMGRGYYDRHFAFRLMQRQCRRPLLIGLAYSVQQVGSLPHAPHDVPLDAIVTESSSLAFHRKVP